VSEGRLFIVGWGKTMMLYQSLSCQMFATKSLAAKSLAAKSLAAERLTAKILAAIVFITIQSCASREFVTAPTAIPQATENPSPSSVLPTVPPTSPSPTAQVSQAASIPPESEIEPIVVNPPIENCKIQMAVINDPEAPLNVRSAPDLQGSNQESNPKSNIVGKLENNTFVSVAEEIDGWFKIENPMNGWIAKNRTDYSCAFVEEIIPLTTEIKTALVQGKIIGTGSHGYTVKLEAGQTLTIENHQAVMPMVISPEAELLNPDGNPEVSQWLVQAPSTGDYTLQLDSNYKGFSYEFLVTVQ